MKVDDTPENGALCICGQCPTYPDQSDPWLYCARGKSPLGIERKGCLCPKCPVQQAYQNKNMYYCDTGAAE